jgi:hypothetical protein
MFCDLMVRMASVYFPFSALVISAAVAKAKHGKHRTVEEEVSDADWQLQ